MPACSFVLFATRSGCSWRNPRHLGYVCARPLRHTGSVSNRIMQTLILSCSPASPTPAKIPSVHSKPEPDAMSPEVPDPTIPTHPSRHLVNGLVSCNGAEEAQPAAISHPTVPASSSHHPLQKRNRKLMELRRREHRFSPPCHLIHHVVVEGAFALCQPHNQPIPSFQFDSCLPPSAADAP